MRAASPARAKFARGDGRMMRAGFERHNRPPGAARAPARSSCSRRACRFREVRGARDPREQMQQLALHRRHIDRRQSGPRIGREHRAQRLIGRNQPPGHVVVHRSPLLPAHSCPFADLSPPHSGLHGTCVPTAASRWEYRPACPSPGHCKDAAEFAGERVLEYRAKAVLSCSRNGQKRRSKNYPFPGDPRLPRPEAR